MQFFNAGRRPPEAVRIYLGLGANVGRPYENIMEAFSLIETECLEQAVLSSLYVTEPQDVKEQPEFINAACAGIFSGSPLELLEKIHVIEQNLGRNRNTERRRGPRQIDIDILLFGNYIVRHGAETDGEGRWLIIPHERLHLRKFALVPMLELCPQLINPVNGREFFSYTKELDSQGIYSFEMLRYIESHGGNI